MSGRFFINVKKIRIKKKKKGGEVEIEKKSDWRMRGTNSVKFLFALHIKKEMLHQIHFTHFTNIT